MLRSTVPLIMISLLLSLKINFTFPIRGNDYHLNQNVSGKADCKHRESSIIVKSKKMAANIGSAIRRIKDTTQVLGKNICDHINIPPKTSAKCFISDQDLRHYEQLVIRKKYPYLDIANFDIKLNPTNKNVRHNIGVQEMSNFNEPNIFEPNEESMNVEIFNRGLSGVTIPNKNARALESTIKNNVKETDIVRRKSDDTLSSLRKDVEEYILKRKSFHPVHEWT